MNNNWELCPKCHGDHDECRICEGTGLINSRTALPPIRQHKKLSPFNPVYSEKLTETLKEIEEKQLRNKEAQETTRRILEKAEREAKRKAAERSVQQEWVQLNFDDFKLKLENINGIGIKDISKAPILETEDYMRACRAKGMREYTNQVETTKTEL